MELNSKHPECLLNNFNAKELVTPFRTNCFCLRLNGSGKKVNFETQLVFWNRSMYSSLLIHKPSPSLYMSPRNTTQMFRLTHLTPFTLVASDVCCVQKMFRTRAKYSDIGCTVKFNTRSMHLTLHTYTHTYRERESRYSATPTWRSVSRNFLLYDNSTHHHP